MITALRRITCFVALDCMQVLKTPSSDDGDGAESRNATWPLTWSDLIDSLPTLLLPAMSAALRRWHAQARRVVSLA